MKKKIILLVLIMFIISGCDAVYTLELKSNKLNETLEINNYNKNTWNSGNPTYKSLIELVESSSVATDYREEVPETNDRVAGVNYYNIEKINKDDNLGIKYQNQFSLKEYTYSTIIFENIHNMEFNYNKNQINISSGKEIRSFNKYSNLDNLTIKFNTNHDVISNNADEIKDNTYYWYLNKNNYLDKKIDLKISTNFVQEKLSVLELDEENYFGEKTLIAIYYILGVIIIIIGGIIFFKIKNSNQ